MMTDLGGLPGQQDSQGRGINASGQIVGWSDDQAVLFDHGSMGDLNQLTPRGSGWLRLQAYAINDQGQIVGDGGHAFLMTPVPMVFNPPPTTPEPAPQGQTSQPPTAPSGLQVQAVYLDLAELTWVDKSNDATSIEVWRQSAAENLHWIATLPAGTTHFTDDGLSLGVTYTYQVRAVNAAGASWSNIVTVTVGPILLPGNGPAP